MRTIGGILVAVGFLIMGLTGACSMWGLDLLLDEGSWDEALLPVLLWGGIPFVIGALIATYGRSLRDDHNSDRFDGR